MKKRTSEDRARHRKAMANFVREQRDTADWAAAYYGVDDPLHPLVPLAPVPSPFTDWLDFVDRVARPLIENDGEDQDAEQEAMKLYRAVSPYYLCTALVMAANQIAGERSSHNSGPTQ
jgi:hypothetical protein